MTSEMLTEIEESDDFESYPAQQYLPAGSSIDTRLLTLELPADSYNGIGLHVARGAGEVVPGMVEGQSLALRCGHSPTMQQQMAYLNLKWKCTRVRFAYSSVGQMPLRLHFEDEHGNDLVGSGASVLPPGWADFRAPEGQYIARIRATSFHHGCVDSLTIWHNGEPLGA
jgi:hypothetical protein